MGRLVPTVAQAVSTFSYDVSFGGRSIGTLQTFGVAHNRTLTRVRGIGAPTTNVGGTIEIVPSITDYTATATMLELYASSFFESYVAAEGGDTALFSLPGISVTAVSSIEQLLAPINITEKLYAPGGATTLRETQYIGCWLQNYSKSGIAANGNLITENVSFWVTDIKRTK